jgi:hypothetical protein
MRDEYTKRESGRRTEEENQGYQCEHEQEYEREQEYEYEHEHEYEHEQGHEYEYDEDSGGRGLLVLFVGRWMGIRTEGGDRQAKA